MKSTQKSCLFALFLVVFVMFELLGSYRLLANNLAPNAYIVLSGSTLTGKTALFSGLYSSDPDGGSIAAYEWAVDGIIQPGSTEVLGVFKYVCTLAEGQTSRTATIRLRVKDDDNGGTWSSYVYKTITISAVNRTEYYLTDHLGSIRTTIDQTGTVIGYDDYDPFGNILPGRSYNAGTPNDLNKFTGVERDTEGNINLDAFGSRLYDSEIGRFYGVDRFHFKYPSLNPFQYAANNPIFFIDVNGDSLISIEFEGTNNLISTDEPILIDHRFKGEFIAMISTAVANGINVQINDSFRTIEEQTGDDLQQNGTTPAGANSRHAAGLGIDFNLFTDNDRSIGVLYGNDGQSSDNNEFIQGINNSEGRFGGDFSDPDPIHLDAGNNQDIQSKYGVSFDQIRNENQSQYNNRPKSIVKIKLIFLNEND